MEYKIGDIVIIRSDLKEKKYGKLSFVFYMNRYRGASGRITKINNNGTFLIDIDNEHWEWSPEMFEERNSMNKINFVYVTIRDGVTKFLYIVPQGVTLEDGEEVFVQVKNSKVNGTVSGGSFEVPCKFLNEFITSEVREKLEFVTGRAIKETWVERPFS